MKFWPILKTNNGVVRWIAGNKMAGSRTNVNRAGRREKTMPRPASCSIRHWSLPKSTRFSHNRNNRKKKTATPPYFIICLVYNKRRRVAGAMEPRKYWIWHNLFMKPINWLHTQEVIANTYRSVNSTMSVRYCKHFVKMMRVFVILLPRLIINKNPESGMIKKSRLTMLLFLHRRPLDLLVLMPKSWISTI